MVNSKKGVDLNMKFNQEKKQLINDCILTKIYNGSVDVSESAADAFGINRNTVHTYINNLINLNIIRRVSRGKYELVTYNDMYILKRENDELESEDYIYDKYFKPYTEHFDKNIKDIWRYSFSEMVNNVIDHSQASELRIVIFRNYLNTFVCLADNGVGIFNKIQNHFKYARIDDAISELYKGKLTTDEKNHSGEGIFFTSKAMDEFYIVSGKKFFIVNKLDNTFLDISEDTTDGTLVCMGISNKSKKELSEVFENYADTDNGFFRTKIIMKNIFDSSPISRSEAKRLCNNLEKFKEVILDFSDIAFMGQGFAHQLFSVFAKNNPQIKIISENMSDDVYKMYMHIINTK